MFETRVDEQGSDEGEQEENGIEGAREAED